MALGAVVYALTWVGFLGSSPGVSPSVVNGLRAVANAPVLLFLELLWVVIFLYMGRSSVTAARMSFHVVRERI